jgi:zinc transport system permease protein
MEPFLARALLGGLTLTLATGPLGCFVVWRRMAYFGAALSHCALLGVALGFGLGLAPIAGVLATCAGVAVALWAMERSHTLPTDTLLGVLAHAALALGLVAIAFVEHLRVDLMGYLFGDVLAVGASDLWLIGGVSALALLCLSWLWNDLISLTVSEELAAVEGVAVDRARLVFVLLLALVVAVGMKVVGMVLIVSLLIVPAAAARRLASTPERMAITAAAVGALSVVGGLAGSMRLDLPSGPLIVVTSVGIFVASLLVPARTTSARDH